MQELSITVSEDRAMTDIRKKGLVLLSSHRSFIMGIAILWVAWFHTDLEIGIPWISFFREIGYGGVDIFFLLTGIGAYFSLKKKPDAALYMKNRILRILPAYYPFIFVWLVMMKITGELYGTEIIGNLTMMGWWHGGRNQFNWYTNAIWLFYLLAPFLVGVIGREADDVMVLSDGSADYKKSAKKKVVITVCLMATGFLASMTFWHTLLLTAFSRLPLFVLGIYLGSEIMKEKQRGVSGTAGASSDSQSSRELFGWQKYPFVFWNMLMAAGFVLLYFCLEKLSGYMWNYGLWWYPFILIAPGLSLDLAYLAELLSKQRIGRWIKNAVSEIGNASFEIFLWHIGVFEFVKPRYEMNGLTWAALLAVVVLWSIGYRKVIDSSK